MRPLLLAALLPLSALAQSPVGFGFAFSETADGGALITSVALGSAAEIAGIQPGDRILVVSGEPLGPGPDALTLLRAAREMLPARLRLERDGEALEVEVGVAPYDAEELRRGTAAFLCLTGDCWNGTGLRVEPSGDWYEGEFLEGRRHGAGVVTLADGRIYSGAFAGGIPNGRGTYRWPDGTYWTGRFIDDVPQPPGTYTDATGASRPGLPD
ncbi:MAG: PDZ domain-containing protein [Bacteroidota bacterium]